MQTCVFVPIAVETMGAINSDGLEFIGDLGRRITQVTDDIREFALECLPVPGPSQFLFSATMRSPSNHTTAEDEF